MCSDRQSRLFGTRPQCLLRRYRCGIFTEDDEVAIRPEGQTPEKLAKSFLNTMSGTRLRSVGSRMRRRRSREQPPSTIKDTDHADTIPEPAGARPHQRLDAGDNLDRGQDDPRLRPG